MHASLTAIFRVNLEIIDASFLEILLICLRQ